MNRLFVFGISVIFIFLTAAPALSVRCGNEVVRVGDTKYEVLSRCGQPVHKEFLGVDQARKISRNVKRGTEVKIEVWIYEAKQLGSTSWDYQFIFSGLELIDIVHISPH